MNVLVEKPHNFYSPCFEPPRLSLNSAPFVVSTILFVLSLPRPNAYALRSLHLARKLQLLVGKNFASRARHGLLELTSVLDPAPHPEKRFNVYGAAIETR